MVRLLLVFCLLLPLAAVAEQSQTINLTPRVNDLQVVLPNNWAPLAFLDQQGRPQGMLVDFWQLLGDKTNRHVQFELIDSQHALRRVKSANLFILGGSIQRDNQSDLSYSNALFPLRTALFVSNQLSSAIAPEDLAGTELGVTAQSYEGVFLHKHYPRLQLHYFNNPGQMIAAAARGELKAFVSDYPVGMFYLDKFSSPDQFRVMTVLYTRSLKAATNARATALLEDINRSLALISPDEMTRLAQKWVNHQEVEVVPIWIFILLCGGLLLLVIGGLAYHNKTLAVKLADQSGELQEQQRQVMLLTSNMTDWIWTIDAGQRFTYISPSIKKLLGYEVEEILGQPMSVVLHPSDYERAYAQLNHTLNAAKRGDFYEYQDIISRYGLLHKNGHLVWTEAALRVFFTPQGEFAGAQGSSRDISERTHAEQAIRQLAFNDPLTQLPNRRLFNDRMQQAIANCARNKHYAAILFMDLDNYKYVNDNYGHDAGDLLLQQVALRLTSATRASDTLARFGGDEFALVAENLSRDFETAKSQVLMIGIKILEVFDKDFVLRELRCHLSTSIGIALFNSDAKSTKALLKYADIAMYQAKANGRNRCVISDYNTQEN